MDYQKAKEICKEAVTLWGHGEQIKLWHEEVGELMHAISKHHRNPTADKLDHVCEETVDVKIMTMQLEIMAPQDRMDYWFDFKMNRLEQRIIAEKERRKINLENAENAIGAEKFELFSLINEIGPNPLDSQIDELIEAVKKYEEYKTEESFKQLF
jgi:NTP pyrophosphatase (non-canonical NTP hydrolase)